MSTSPSPNPVAIPNIARPRGCVVGKIDDFKRVPRDPKASRVEKQRALKFLIHFIADLHQPLHVGETGSRGGNLIQVRFYNRGSNLHRVWDVQIMERHSDSEQAWIDSLNFIGISILWSKSKPGGIRKKT
jgi:hypothetical protein